jgi:nitroimidazol reductase NimA-like FMN-containing flavoprotein (pyridoxamine 5'-phosphate oxidase superfamily)
MHAARHPDRQVEATRTRISMSTTTAPVVRELTQGECKDFLATKSTGRIAFSLHDRVDVQPFSYVSDGDWIFGRTSEGSKLTTLVQHPWCAFETDEVQGTLDWTSVVIKGTFSILDPRVGSLHTYQRAETLLRGLYPDALCANDPVAHRNILFGIFGREVTGRESRS